MCHDGPKDVVAADSTYRPFAKWFNLFLPASVGFHFKGIASGKSARGVQLFVGTDSSFEVAACSNLTLIT